MDRLEKEVLAILAEDCRYPAAKIAVMLEETEEKIANAIR